MDRDSEHAANRSRDQSASSASPAIRVEITPRAGVPDGRAARLARSLATVTDVPIHSATVCDALLLGACPDPGDGALADLFQDAVAQDIWVQRTPTQQPPAGPWNLLIEITYRPGVTDPVGMTALHALQRLASPPGTPAGFVQSARQYRFHIDGSALGSGLQTVADVAARVADVGASLAAALHNPLIERAQIVCGERAPDSLPLIYPNRVAASPSEVQTFDLPSLSDAQLEELSKQRLLSLTLAEMSAIRDYFANPETGARRRTAGLGSACTDVELEMIAQTWSEHCKHKIFQAEIDYTEFDEQGNETGRERIRGLFPTFIKHVTETLAANRSDLKSVFHDNAGVVTFDDQTDVCFKAETHNSPSALDPYGGAITGIVGVNRDILGTGKGAKPILNTNVLCFGELDTPADAIPEGLMHPRRVLAGVHHGIVDGGNQSGIPTVAGAVLFDDSYVGKPLVFCGTAGVLPAQINGEASWIKHIDPGHRVVMVGGRIGKDGIHGATFSSLALDESSPVSAVQIGDPITQRNMTDFLLEARDRGLYAGITDNGAGGLSSSLGEMAQYSGGVRIDLDRCPLKYPGLAAWEILVSESQERMSLSVEPERLDELLALARSRSVEATDIGEFTNSGAVEITHADRLVGRLDLSFLHDGCPRMQLRATWRPPRPAARPTAASTPAPGATPETATATLLALLAEPNIASKEVLVRQYDHEVQAGSVIKPFVGVESDAPSDGAVWRVRTDSNRGLTVTHGICPRYSDADTYDMAMCAVDEAFRAHVALGGDPDRAYALDNFCWPDPVQSAETPDGEYKLAQLVRACRGLADACLAYGLPLISGKDSMKNDARLAGRKVSVRPTLLVSLMGIIEDITTARSTDFIAPGHLIYLVGDTRGELGGTLFEKLYQRAAAAPPRATAAAAPHLGAPPHVHPQTALARYRALHAAITRGLVASCHDLSDGGLAVALAESCIGGRLGARIDIAPILSALASPTAATAAIAAADAAAAVADAATAPSHGAVSLEHRALFCETPSRFIVSVPPEQRARFEAALAPASTATASNSTASTGPAAPASHGILLGRVTEHPHLAITAGAQPLLDLSVADAAAAFGRLSQELA